MQGLKDVMLLGPHSVGANLIIFRAFRPASSDVWGIM